MMKKTAANEGSQTLPGKHPRRATVRLFHPPKNMVVILMTSDPEPIELVFIPERDGPVGAANFEGPESSFLMKSEGRVKRVLLEEFVLFKRKVLHFGGKAGKQFPKARRSGGA